MPGHGGEYHDYLKKETMKRIAEVYGKSVRIIKSEQITDGGALSNFIKMTIGIIIPGENPITPQPVIYPDFAVMVKMDEEEKRYIIEEIGEKKSIIDKAYLEGRETKTIFIECETATSQLTRGERMNKTLVYEFIKNNMDPLVCMICSTFDNTTIESNIFKNVWRFPKPMLGTPDEEQEAKIQK